MFLTTHHASRHCHVSPGGDTVPSSENMELGFSVAAAGERIEAVAAGLGRAVSLPSAFGSPCPWPGFWAQKGADGAEEAPRSVGLRGCQQ